MFIEIYLLPVISILKIHNKKEPSPFAKRTVPVYTFAFAKYIDKNRYEEYIVIDTSIILDMR